MVSLAGTVLCLAPRGALVNRQSSVRSILFTESVSLVFGWRQQKRAGELKSPAVHEFGLGETKSSYALRRGRMLRSRTCAIKLERCMESSLPRYCTTSA